PLSRSICPLHRNPQVRSAIRPAVEGLHNVWLIEPLPYAQFTKVLSLADIVLTDSGGVQEEAPSLGTPVLVMRENTERPEAVLAGTVNLVGTERHRLVEGVCLLPASDQTYRAMAHAANPYGDGRAAERTVGALRWKFLGGSRPVGFAA